MELSYKLNYKQKREAKKLFNKLMPSIFGTRKNPYEWMFAKDELGNYLLTKVAHCSFPYIFDVHFNYNEGLEDELVIYVSYESQNKPKHIEEIEFII